ncbi:MAG: sulfite exporter TauE/SafE family protein [Rhodospirillaceae bacterium]
MDAVLTFLHSDTGLEAWVVWLLLGVSFAGSFLTAALGLGGGILAIAAMALFLPPAAVIPLHGVMQLGANSSRAWLMRKHLRRDIVPLFFVGTVLGALLGAQVVVALPVGVLRALIGLFILFAIWAPHIRASNPGRRTFFAVGAVGAFTTMFVGATGMLIAPFVIAASTDRHQIVATHAVLMTMQHLLKIVAFVALGFAFGPYLPLLGAWMVAAFAGAWVGRMALNRLPEQVFRTALKWILTALALRLLYDALTGWLA